MPILPKVEDDGRISIPWWEIPLIWSWRCLTLSLALIGGGGMVVINMIGFENLSDASTIAIFAGAFITTLLILFFASYDAFRKQQLDAATLKAKKACGESLSVAEQIEIEKAVKFDVRYSIGLMISIIAATALGIIAAMSVGLVLDVPDSWPVYAVISVGCGGVFAIFVDKYIVHSAIDGKFRTDVLTPVAEKIEADSAKNGEGEVDSNALIQGIIDALTKAKR